MTEVAFYPIATVALLAMARALETPSLERQAVAVTAILLASLTRLQALALLPVLIMAIVVAAVFERSPRLLRRFAVTLGLLSLAGVLVVVFNEAGASRDMLGAYTTTARSSYQAGAAARWVLWHAGDVFLIVAGAPLLATAVLAVDAFRGRERAPAARALLAVTVSYVPGRSPRSGCSRRISRVSSSSGTSSRSPRRSSSCSRSGSNEELRDRSRRPPSPAWSPCFPPS